MILYHLDLRKTIGTLLPNVQTPSASLQFLLTAVSQENRVVSPDDTLDIVCSDLQHPLHIGSNICDCKVISPDGYKAVGIPHILAPQ